MAMELRQLSHFIRVVEAGSLSSAGAALMLSQPTLSRQVALLETEFGQRLLTRTGRGVEPTEAGRVLLGHAKAIIEQAERAREELRDMNRSPRGRVVVGLPPRVATVATTRLVQRFRSRFPQAVVTVAEGLSVHLREWLIDGRIDLALLFDPPASPQLSYEKLAHESLILAAPRAVPRLGARVTLESLANHPLVLPSSPNAIRSLLDRALSARNVRLQIIAEVNTVQASLALVCDGVGSTVLPESAVASSRLAAKLQVARIGPPAIRNTLVLATPLARPSTRLTRETTDLLRDLDLQALDRVGR
jgi:LysR family nitrogen assimilation transcriptional regulator